MIEVTMTLPDSAEEDATALKRLFRMKDEAATVETALGLTRRIAEVGGKHGRVIVRNADGGGEAIDLRPFFAAA